MILKKRSSYKVDLNALENLRLTKKVDYYELLNNNSEICFYWRGIGAKQVKEFNFQFEKKFEIKNQKKLYHSCYLYYDQKESQIYTEDI